MTSAVSLLPADVRAARVRIVAVFALHAVMFTTLNQRMPDFQVRLGLDDATLGLTLMGASVGAFATVFSASQVIARLGSRMTLLGAFPLNAAFGAVVALAPNAPLMFAAMIGLGATFTIGNVAMNVEADRVEAATGGRIMSRCHGVWSVGVFASSSLAGLLRARGLDPQVHVVALAPLIALATLAVVEMAALP